MRGGGGGGEGIGAGGSSSHYRMTKGWEDDEEGRSDSLILFLIGPDIEALSWKRH